MKPLSTMGMRRRILARVLSRRCPQCGRGALFARYARLHPRCADCGLVYRREAGAQTGSMYLTAALGELFAAVLIFLFWTLFDWTPRTYVAVTAPLVLVFSALVLPLSQAVWVGIEYATDVEGHEPWVEPRD